MTGLADFPIGSTVIVKTFLSTHASPRDVAPADDYWKLVGCKGMVVSNDELDKLAPDSRGARVLVRLDADIRALGLHCHNPVENALYLFLDDLDKIA